MVDITIEQQSAIALADEAGRSRERMRYFLGGFGLGIAIDLVYTTVQVGRREYTLADAPELLLWNLASVPYLSAIMGLVGLIRTRPPRPWKWRWPRLRTRTLMLLVAYLAFLFSVVVSSNRLTRIYIQHFVKSANSASMAKTFRDQVPIWESDARLRRENIVQLQAGKIPEGLYTGQADFLRSLEADPKLTPEYREYRRSLIQETQVRSKDTAEHAIDLYRRLTDHFEQLATKYDQAQWRPWLPVEPDPPVPK